LTLLASQSFLLPEQPGWEGRGEAIVESQTFKKYRRATGGISSTVAKKN